MTAPEATSAPRLVESLAALAARRPLERKLVVAPSMGAGRELLRRLALTRSGWIGFEVTTPRPLALRLARPGMEGRGLSLLDHFEARALVDEAIDAALASAGATLAALSDGVGFRDRVHGAVEALRLAGVEPARVERARLAPRGKAAFLGRVLARYQQLLRERRRADTADVLALAVEALEAEGSSLPAQLGADVVVLVPGLGTRGAAGKLLSSLAARGAKVLETEAVAGLAVPPKVLWRPARTPHSRAWLSAPGELPSDLPAPETDFFRAASIHDELREVLRRARARGLRWDQVEIVATDPAAYGSVLHALGVQLGVPVTYAVGLPIARTRTGRVVRAYLDWIEEGFQADPIRRLLEAGDLRPPRRRAQHPPAALARRFRSLRVGWGRQRYRSQIRAALAGVDRIPRGRRESEEALGRRRARIRSELEALRSILFPALKETPAVPDRMGDDGKRVSPAEIARGLRAFLRRVPRGHGPDRQAREEVERVLERIEVTLVRRTAFRAAVTVLRRHLDLRVRAAHGSDEGEETAPWGSQGGHLHLSDLEHGGYTGRDAVFVVGLDADRAPGFEGQDPVLLDRDRRVLDPDLPTSHELSRERAFRFAALYARLHGAVTLSYSAWDAAEARSLGPSPILLQALRLARRDPQLSFEDLEAALGRVVCAAPAAERPALDAVEAWMGALGDGGLLRSGMEAVAAAFPRLGAGMEARRARSGPPGPVHGVVRPRPELLDPRRNPSLVVSASRLEALGVCPLRYLQGTVLGLRPPDDPELDPERWLDPLRRGALLHGVYEVTLREARSRGLSADDPAFEELALGALAAGVTRMQAEVPVPGEGALRREVLGLQSDVRAFVRMVQEHGAPWIALELKFGLGDEPVTLEVTGGTLRIRGAIDRVDEDLAGLHVIDYKTGFARDFAGTGTFDGGRRLQHAIYAHAAEQRLGATVVRGVYQYPTIRGENRVEAFDRLSLAGVHTLLGHLLDGVADGSFVPTERADDCRMCDFAAVCRVRTGSWGSIDAPLSAWSEEQLNAGLRPAFEHLKRARTFES